MVTPPCVSQTVALTVYNPCLPKPPRREAVRETLREKLDLEERARRVVERLLEDSVADDILVDCARLITLANYKDTVEERSIVKLCGYPVCSNKLGKVSTQQFKISTKTNKVYDITERKSFCSNFCYKASKSFELQISKSPLWLRQHESPPDVKLMKKGDGGSTGEEVRLAERRLREDDVENPLPLDSVDDSDAEQDFVSSVVSQRRGPRVHWGDLPERTAEVEVTIQDRDPAPATSPALTACSVQNQEPAPNPSPQGDPAQPTQPGINITQVGMSRRGARGLLKGNEAGTKPASVRLNLLEGLRRTFTEWMTEETMKFLYGPDHFSKTLIETNEEKEEELDEDDLEGSGEGGETDSEGGPGRPSAPAPDYDTLRRETEEMGLRVREFYKGTEEVQRVSGKQHARGGDLEVSGRGVYSLRPPPTGRVAYSHQRGL
uniref:RNA polymerase II subunit B1 CTD phosphatase RPAP2 homolog n=1 Tax=Hucho hucho TaxID=62062 RepID=A0A4W5NM48_9TELE